MFYLELKILFQIELARISFEKKTAFNPRSKQGTALNVKSKINDTGTDDHKTITIKVRYVIFFYEK